MRRAASAITLLAVLAAGLARAAEPRAQLQALRERRAAEEAAVRALQQREGSILGALEASERAIREAEAKLAEAERARATAEDGLTRARTGEASAEGTLAALRGRLGPRLRARARLDALSELRLLAGSDSLADLVKRRWLWRRVTEHDLQLLGRARTALAEGEAARHAREREAARLAAAGEEAERQRGEGTARRDEHRALLARVREERAVHQRAAAEAAAQEEKLADFLQALPPPVAGRPTGPGVGGAFAQLRGRLPHPAEGEVSFGFGRVVDPRFNTVTVQHGVDIHAPAGAEVRAVAPGRVAHAGWFRGYGNLVIVDHGDGYHTLVAHLASMSTAVGEQVERGALLGTVGDTGSLKGAYLYFEVRERGRPVDPRTWLRP